MLENGEVLEYDDLEKLRNDPTSHFGGMLSKADAINESLK